MRTAFAFVGGMAVALLFRRQLEDMSRSALEAFVAAYEEAQHNVAQERKRQAASTEPAAHKGTNGAPAQAAPGCEPAQRNQL